MFNSAFTAFHFSPMSTTIFRSSFYQLHPLRSISETSCSALVHAFITSRLDYCNSLLAGIGDGLIAQLQSLMHVAARYVLRRSKFDPISADIRDRLFWLLYVQELTSNLVFLFTNVCMATLLRILFRCFCQNSKFLLSVVFVRLLPRGTSNINHDIWTTKFFCFRSRILELITRSPRGPLIVNRYF